MADKNDKQFPVELAYSRHMRKNIGYILPKKCDVPFYTINTFLRYKSYVSWITPITISECRCL